MHFDKFDTCAILDRSNKKLTYVNYLTNYEAFW